jgi:hypothetical protein
MKLAYLAPRIVRHFMPSALARLLLRRKIIIRPGIETVDPAAAVKRYIAALEPANFSLAGKRVMVFGYGGNFGVGCGLLRAGASHVVLCDRFAPPDDQRNHLLLPEYSAYLEQSGDTIRPKAGLMTLLDADIRQAARERWIEPVDLIVSSSVFEHLDDVEGITRALAALTQPDDGLGMHFIDLRDHFFRYPFEMLRYSARVWKGWLNPGTNLNRFRVRDYRRVFEGSFAQVQIDILEQDQPAFDRARPFIRSEFLSGNSEEDAATIIRACVSHPKSE